MHSSILTIAHLTLYDARRRRVMLAAALCGAAFLIVYTVGLYFGHAEMVRDGETLLKRQVSLSIITIVGLFAANFLSVLFAVLLPVDALSGEIDSGVMQTLAAKPVRRADILLGKWLAYCGIALAYLLTIAGGVLLAGRLLAGHTQLNIGLALPLMALEIVLLVTISIAGGTRLSTVTNGIAALGFYGIAFIGGWMEQVGTIAGISSARTVGVVASLISPPDALWRLASYHMQPSFARDVGAGPFFAGSVPTPYSVGWAAIFTLLVLAWAVRSFNRRQL